MARTVRNPKLDTRSARAKLPTRKAPYWTAVSPGCALGYRKGIKGGTWLAKVVRDGVRKELAIAPADDVLDAGGGVLSFAEAQATARAWFVKVEKDSNDEDGRNGPYTVRQCVEDYLGWLSAHRKSAAGSRNYAEVHILPELGHLEVGRLTTSRIRTWHKTLAETPARLRTRQGEPPRYRPLPTDADGKRARKATANRVLTILKAALNHAYHNGRAVSDDAWRRVRPFREVDAARLRYLSRDECRRLLNACPEDFRGLVRGALFSGCRYGELIRCCVEDINGDAGTLLIREAKSGRPRHVPLDAEARAFFATLCAGRRPSERLFVRANGAPWGKAHQIRPMAEASQAARLEPAANFHCLRHTWASHRVMAGAPLIVVAQVLGHSDSRMVEKHYGHLARSYVQEVIERTALGIGLDEQSVVVPIGRSGGQEKTI
jgi:integrase